MDLKFVLHLLVLTAAVELRSIQVYEDVDDTPLVPFSDSIRTTREPNKYQRIRYSGVAQQDPQKWRYFQQQKVDARNRARNKLLLRKGIKKREVGVLTSPQAHSINLGLDHGENLRLLRESLKAMQQDKEIQALNALLGQSPTAQLQGLNQLLRPRDHTPIKEDFVDVANPQIRPNIKVEPAPLELQEAVAREHVARAQTQQRIKQIEKELSAVAQAQAEEALAKAHHAAVTGAEAHHHAMAAAQSQAAQAAIHKAHTIFDFNPVLLQHKGAEENRKGYGEDKDDAQYASQYAFGYQVRDYHSSNNFGHEEVHDGHSAKGHYHVLLPDGRLQRVHYWADETGFHAKVTYDKVAHHPH